MRTVPERNSPFAIRSSCRRARRTTPIATERITRYATTWINGAVFAYLLTLVPLLLLCACAGKVDYQRPSVSPTTVSTNEKIVSGEIDDVWVSTVKSIGKRPMVIENLDQAARLIVVSYSGDPEPFIDCGRISYIVSGVSGTKSYEFAGASANETFQFVHKSSLYNANRRMTLNAVANIVLEEMPNGQSKVSVSARYLVHREFTSQYVGGGSAHTKSDKVSFTSSSGGSFPKKRRRPRHPMFRNRRIRERYLGNGNMTS